MKAWTAALTLSLSLSFFSIPLPAEPRVPALRVFLIFDGSSMNHRARTEALRWVDDEIIDRLLQEGDECSLWLPGEGPGPVYSETLRQGNELNEKDKLKARLRSTPPGGADYTGSLREAAAAAAQGPAPYTLLITGVGGAGGAHAPGTGAGAELLRYSRILEFPGWRAQVVGLGIAPQVQAAAAAFMAGQ